MLSREDLAELATIFSEALDLDPAARRALIDARCGSRPDLRAEIDSLLAAHERADSFLAPPSSERSRASDPLLDAQTPVEGPAPNEGALVGAWRLLHKIGSGGMGDVYLAERADDVFEGRAAVKFTRAHLPDMDAARRFRAERQFLASLHHANIVTLLDGGTTPGGQGYLVMEYVEGTPISTFCQAHALTLEARLSLMQQVCAAVQYAHQRAIVHRDLKPTNILVTGDGIPKILDFGIAKIVEGAAAVDGNMTGAGMPVALTPNYASPEQLRGLGVTTACDVYSLGVLLYEVIAGARPYETTGKALDAVIKAVVDTEPHRPSDAPADAPLPYPRASLRGDLDAIVLKAMRKEPEQRYRSAGELGDDIGRFLGHEVVVARAPSMGYVLRRVAARQRGAVTVAAVALIAIVGALGLALWQRHVAIEARQQSERRFREVRQLANALIFKIHDSVAKLPGATPVRREIVNEALGYLERLERESAGDVALQMELAGAYRQIGSILGDPSFPNLGDRPAALAQLTKSRNLLRPLADSPRASEDAIVAIVNTDNIISRLTADDAGALAVANEAMRYSQQAVDRSMPRGKELLAKAVFAVASKTKPARAQIPHWERAGRLFEELLAEKPDDPGRQRNVALVGKYLGFQLEEIGQKAEALKHYERALLLDERRLAAAPDNRMVRFDTAISYANVATIREESEKDQPLALPLFRKSLVLRQALSESDPQDVLTRARLGYARYRVARLELRGGDVSEAFDLARKAVEDHEHVRAKTKAVNSTRELGAALETLGEVEWALGHRASACGRFRRSIELLAPLTTADASARYYLTLARKNVAACRN
jgi:tRNA A-37 threonylcarbamoyl transferase component Bud32/tetratricopeptide (TPR) repeat protein